VNVIGWPSRPAYWNDLEIELWPWAAPAPSGLARLQRELLAGRRRAVRLAGERYRPGRGALYGTPPRRERHPGPAALLGTNPPRLGNMQHLDLEIANEYTRNEPFRTRRPFFKRTTRSTTPSAARTAHGRRGVAGQAWKDLAINHTALVHRPPRLRGGIWPWPEYAAHGKPAWCTNPAASVATRTMMGCIGASKAALYAAGCFWTWHSWDGCEGIMTGPTAHRAKRICVRWCRRFRGCVLAI